MPCLQERSWHVDSLIDEPVSERFEFPIGPGQRLSCTHRLTVSHLRVFEAADDVVVSRLECVRQICAGGKPAVDIPNTETRVKCRTSMPLTSRRA